MLFFSPAILAIWLVETLHRIRVAEPWWGPVKHKTRPFFPSLGNPGD